MEQKLIYEMQCKANAKTALGGKENGKTLNAVANSSPPHIWECVIKPIKCKHCHSTKVYKKGKRKDKNSITQRWYCRECKRTFQYRPNFAYPCKKCGKLISDSKTFRKIQCNDCRIKYRKEKWKEYKKNYLDKLIKLGSTSCNLDEHATRKPNGKIDFEKERIKIDKEKVRVFKYNGSNPHYGVNSDIWLME